MILYGTSDDLAVGTSERGVGLWEISRLVAERVLPMVRILVSTHRLALAYRMINYHALGVIDVHGSLGWPPTNWSPRRLDQILHIDRDMGEEGMQGPQDSHELCIQGSVWF